MSKRKENMFWRSNTGETLQALILFAGVVTAGYILVAITLSFN